MKKKLTIVLALLLAFSVFVVACGKKEEEKKDEKKEEKVEEKAEDKAEEKEEKAEEKEEEAADDAEEPADDAGEPAADGEIHIEVVSKGLQHQFWVNVQNGCQQAADDYGATMSFDGPANESDIQDQVDMLENSISKNPDAICLAALDVQSVMQSLENAQSAGIPIIGFDSGVPGAPEGSVYANASTDNKAAGALAAENLYSVIEDEVLAATPDAQVRIAVLSQDASSESIMGRTQGFIDEMKELVGDSVAVVGSSAYADGDEASVSVVIDVGIPAKTDVADIDASCAAILEKEGVVAIYASNEFAAESMIRTGEALGGILGNRAEDDSKVWGIGFDAGKLQREAVENGTLFGAITQDPVQIGYKAVELAIKAAKGEPVEDIDTGAKFYNAENLSDPEIDVLVYE
ncbi:MAG: substrate-binding domain-containing protein [Clostridiaceae bacterium]|nr:substrate-binding domain-containing protein [Clostridiaceae bacterium]